MIKNRAEDFRVTERLAEGYLEAEGPFTVYRVRKKKLTSFEAAQELAELAGVPRDAVSFAGLKDRQGVTIQYMSVEGGKPVALKVDGLTIEPVGRAQTEIQSVHSLGNEFEITLREIRRNDLEKMRDAAEIVRRCGVPNYFDEQRFGNLRHGQGWVARDLMMGRNEQALKRLLCSDSRHDNDRTAKLKRAMRDSWRDWRRCRDIAGKLGAHHSVFEHLAREPRDYPGAFRRVASRVRLIHLFAYQSHLWNRVAVAFLKERLGRGDYFELSGIEGPLVFPRQEFQVASDTNYTLRLPGPHLKDVGDEQQRRLFEEVLRAEGLSKRTFNIEGIPGFALKGEDRPLIVVPEMKPIQVQEGKGSVPGRDKAERRDDTSIKVRFSLPRGAYATIVIKRLLANKHSRHDAMRRRFQGPQREERTESRKWPRKEHKKPAPEKPSPWNSGSRRNRPDKHSDESRSWHKK